MLKNIDKEKILATLLSQGGDHAEIFAEQTVVTTISHENRNIEKVSRGTDAGYGLRLIVGDKTLYGYTNDPSALQELARTISNNPDRTVIPAHAGIPLDQPDPCLPSKKPAGKRRDDERGNDKAKIGMVISAADTAWRSAPEIKQVQVNWRDTFKKIWVANSDGLYVEDERSDMIMLVLAIVEKNGVIQTGYEPSGGNVNLNYFDPENIAKEAVRRAITMLNAGKAPRGAMPVVISSQAGGTMIHEAVGHGLEADLACQGMSVYKDKLGQMVASKKVTVVDDPTLPIHRGSFKFDDEGTPARKTVLIENGVLKSYLYDNMAAKKTKTASTGNGRRESYRNRPVVRMTNTLMTQGKDDPASIIRSVKNGLFVKKMGGGQVNTLNGDFVFEAQEAYLIDNGAVGPAVRGATIIGNGPKVLMDIDMVGTDIGFGLGTCGKEGQGVPVGHGMPTIRLPEINVGGTG